MKEAWLVSNLRVNKFLLFFSSPSYIWKERTFSILYRNFNFLLCISKIAPEVIGELNVTMMQGMNDALLVDWSQTFNLRGMLYEYNLFENQRIIYTGNRESYRRMDLADGCEWISLHSLYLNYCFVFEDYMLNC